VSALSSYMALVLRSGVHGPLRSLRFKLRRTGSTLRTHPWPVQKDNRPGQGLWWCISGLPYSNPPRGYERHKTYITCSTDRDRTFYHHERSLTFDSLEEAVAYVAEHAVAVRVAT
jgi:hypothetical protein